MNLTELSRNFKKGLKFLALAVVLYYLTTILIIPGVKLLLQMSFPEKNPPNPAFGKLPPLTLMEKPINEETPVYSLNTTTGKLPTGFPDRMTVYKFQKIQKTILRGTEATADSEFLGFTDEDLSSDKRSSEITWSNREYSSELKIDLETNELIMDTQYEKHSSQYPQGTLNEETATKTAQDLFKKLRRFDDSLYPFGKSEVYLGAISGVITVKPYNTRENQVARVDLFRNINGYPILGQDPKVGLLHAIVKKPIKPNEVFNYPIIKAYYKEIITESDATYPILTVREAWNAVAENKGVITSVLPKEYNPFEEYRRQKVENILIDNIYLAYYETQEHQEFLQPIWVFEGKYVTRNTDGGDITLYYPAIKGEYIRREATDTNN